MEKVKFAVIGYGHIGKRHCDMIKAHDQAELIAVADIDESQKPHCQENYGVPFFNTAQDLLDSDLQFDVVNVCTPNGCHAEQAKMALRKNCHVVVEKPMGLNKANCEEITHLALEKSKKVFCVMQNRYSPPSVWLKDVIGKKVLGEIYLIQVNCYWNRDDRYYSKSKWKGTLALDGGPLFTQFSHFMDLVYWLFGDLTDSKARFQNFNHKRNTEFEDSGLVSFKLVNGGIGTFNYSTSVYNTNLESSLTIIGENGTIKVGGQYMNKVELCDIEDYEMPELPPVNPPNDYGTYKGSAANHHFVINNVVDTLLGNAEITTNALEGLKVVEIIEEIYKQRDLSSWNFSVSQ